MTFYEEQFFFLMNNKPYFFNMFKNVEAESTLSGIFTTGVFVQPHLAIRIVNVRLTLT